MYSTQLRTEQTYNKRNIRQWVLDDVMHSAVFTDMFVHATDAIDKYRSGSYYKSKDIRISQLPNTEDIAIQLFCTVLQTRQDEPIQGVATALGLCFYDHQLDAVKTGAELLAVCQSIGLYTILSAFSTEHMHDTAIIRPKYQLDDDTLHKIHMTMYLPPMLCSPIPWTDNRHGGHLLGSSSCILGTGNDINQSQSLDVLNKLQSIKWTLNTTMLLEDELPKETYDLTDSKEREKAQQHNARCIQSRMVYDYILANDNEFFFVWKYDKRGRMYSQGYDINLQGSEYKKATIEFANTELLTGI